MVEFVRNRATGTVHVAVPRNNDEAGGMTVPVTGESVTGFLLGHVHTLCGRTIARHRGGMEVSGAYVTRFNDEDLCAACWKAYPADQRSDLFEHPEPDPAAPPEPA